LSHRNKIKINSYDPSTIQPLNNSLDILYRTRLESLHKFSESGIDSFKYHVAEYGEADFTATGSPTITRSFSYKEKKTEIIHYNAHARSTLAVACVTNVTQTSIEITVRTISGTANFSDVVGAAGIKVSYQLVGTQP
jgi:predicted PP-loop superfamily ATPase